MFLGGIFLFSSPEFILAGEICQKPHSIWSIWAPRAPFLIYTPIYGAGMDALPRGEGGVPRPAPPRKNDQNRGEVAGQNNGPNLNFLQ